jgi:copper chaperone CopZ
MPRMRVEIGGMRTVHCVRAVFTALTGVPGIDRAEVARNVAVIDHDGRATEESVREAVAVAGYEVLRVSEERRGLTVLDEE